MLDEPATYLVVSDIIAPKGCDLWVSPYGGREEVENFYRPENRPYEVVPIPNLTNGPLEALTECHRGAGDGAQGFCDAVWRTTQEAYRAGLNGMAMPTFTRQWRTGALGLQEAIATCIGAAYAVGRQRHSAAV